MCEYSGGEIVVPAARICLFVPKIRLGKLKSSLKTRAHLLAVLYILVVLLNTIGWLPLSGVCLFFIGAVVCMAWDNTCHLVVWLEVAVLCITCDLNLWLHWLFLFCGPLLSCLVIEATGRKSPMCALLGLLEPYTTRLRRRLHPTVMWLIGTVADIAKSSYEDYSRNVSIVDMPCATATEQNSLYCSSRRVLGDIVQDLLPEDPSAWGNIFSNVFGPLVTLEAWGNFFSSVFGPLVTLEVWGNYFSNVFGPLGTLEGDGGSMSLASFASDHWAWQILSMALNITLPYQFGAQRV